MNIKKERILKALVLLGLIAIAVSLYIQYGAPYLHEHSLQKLDEKRIDDLNSLNGTLQEILKTNSKVSFGNSNTVYVSIPSNNPTCTDLNLPSLPDAWQYHCVATSTLQNTDGTGWLPVALTNISSLPTDPINNQSQHYSFITLNKRYELSAQIGSQKYVAISESDRGSDPLGYEIGDNLQLLGQATGLVMSFPYEPDATPTTLFSLKYPAQKIEIDGFRVTSKNLVLTMWVKLAQSDTESYELVEAPKSFILYGYNTHTDLDIFGSIYGSARKQIFAGDVGSINYNEWHQVGLFYGSLRINGKNTLVIANIIDGELIDPTTVSSSTTLTFDSIIINKRKTYSGTIGNLRIYNSPLTASDIERQYTLESKLLFNNK
ncbi:MAG: LamG-like jellyroll fold domain-containing protein [bacterium]